MEYFILFLVVIMLVGSISIAIPSKSSRKISKLRIEAKMIGFKISSMLYGKNNFKNKQSHSVSYQIKNKSDLKEGHFIRDKDSLILYSPVKLKYSDNFQTIERKLKDLSESIDEIIFTESYVYFLWKELDGLEELKDINEALTNLKFFKINLPT